MAGMRTRVPTWAWTSHTLPLNSLLVVLAAAVGTDTVSGLTNPRVAGRHAVHDWSGEANRSGIDAHTPDTASAGAWKRCAPMPTPRSSLASVLLADGSVLALGGAVAGSASISSAVERYHPSNDSWTTMPSMHALFGPLLPHRSHAGAIATIRRVKG